MVDHPVNEYKQHTDILSTTVMSDKMEAYQSGCLLKSELEGCIYTVWLSTTVL